MPKLQRVTRPSGTERYSLSIDSDLVSEMGWEKGQHLNLDVVINKDNTKHVILVED